MLQQSTSPVFNTIAIFFPWQNYVTILGMPILWSAGRVDRRKVGFPGFKKIHKKLRFVQIETFFFRRSSLRNK